MLLEKWLLTKPRVLLLNDVTRGVDIATKLQIYALIAEIAARRRRGALVLDRYPGTGGLAHRVLVMLEGRINATLSGEEITVREHRPRINGPRGRRCARGGADRASPSGDNWPVLVFAACLRWMWR